MYLIVDGNGFVVAVRARIRDHLAARRNADRIDRELACGASPDATLESALRSRALTSNRSRRTLALGLQRALARANASPAGSSAVVPVNSAEIISATPDILELHRLLITDGPVSVCGVAQTRLLLSTVAGPFFSRRTAANLGPCVRRAIEAMNIRQNA